MGKKAWIILIAVGCLVLLGSCDEIDSAMENDGGRAYMLSQPCSDVMTEYTAMEVMGRSAALQHVSNVCNVKTGTTPYIAVSDVSVRVDQ